MTTRYKVIEEHEDYIVAEIGRDRIKQVEKLKELCEEPISS